MITPPLGLAFVGCGVIADQYAAELSGDGRVALRGATDLDPARAARFARDNDCVAYASLADALADPGVHIAVNLTPQHAHADVTRACLRAGKHVYSEKPMALATGEASALADEAARSGLRLACAPCTFLGEAQQTALRWLRSGRLGEVRLVCAEVNAGRVETWHPAPQPFYAVGPLFDVGPYPLTIITAALGPVRRVWAHGRTLLARRTALDGRAFEASAPDAAVVLAETAGGALVRLTANFYAHRAAKLAGIEFHGDAGSLHLASNLSAAAAVSVGVGNDAAYDPIPLPATAAPGPRWGRGIVDLAEAIRSGRPHRASAEQAAHIIEVLCAAQESMHTGAWTPVASGFEPPALLEPAG